MLISQQATLTPLAETLLLIHLISDKGGLIHDLPLKQSSTFPKQLRCPNLELCPKYLEHCHSPKTHHKRLLYTK